MYCITFLWNKYFCVSSRSSFTVDCYFCTEILFLWFEEKTEKHTLHKCTNRIFYRLHSADIYMIADRGHLYINIHSIFYILFSLLHLYPKIKLIVFYAEMQIIAVNKHIGTWIKNFTYKKILHSISLGIKTHKNSVDVK